MLKTLTQAMTSRAAGPVATVLALGMGATLAISWTSFEVRREALEAQVAQLTRDAERRESLVKAQLSACHAAAAGRDRLTEAAYGGGDPEQLLREPEGIDACARMESADQAVLSNLK